MANQVIVTNTGNVQVALTPPPNVQVQISRAVVGTISNVPTANFANFAGNVTSANQPNITSLGTLSNLSVSGNTTVNNLTVTGNLSAGNLIANTANFANFAGVANTANSVALANVSGAGNIASINLDGNVANLLTGNGTFVAIPTVSANANFANFAGTAFNVSGSNVTGAVANATFAANAGNANIANTANSVAVANVSGIGNIATVNLDGNASNILYGNGAFSAAPSVSNVANANYANFAGTAFNVSGSNVSGEVANANFASYANISSSANSVAVANVSGIGNIATVNLDGNASNILYGNGIFATTPIISNVANANYANFAGEAFNVNASNITGTVANANYSAYAGEANTANLATFATTANAVAGANVSGEVANANFASYSNIAATANSVALANVVGIGNIANINLDGSSSNVLFGNGVFAPESTSIANANYANFAGNALVLANGTSNISIPVANGNVNISTNNNANIAQFDANGALFLYPTTNSLNALRITSFGNPSAGDVSRIASSRARGNITTPLSVNGSDRLMRFLAFGHNGANYQTSSVGTFQAQVDSSYTANGANIPIGWNMSVNDTNGGVNNQSKVHNFYANGNVVFANSVFATDSFTSGGNITSNTGVFNGNGAGLTNLPASSIIANGTSNISIPVANGDINISSNGVANIISVFANGLTFITPPTTVNGALTIDSYGNPLGDVHRINSRRARGNATTPLSVNPGDATMRLLTFGHNGTAYQINSTASIRGLVDSSYTANGANIPFGWSISVNDTNGGINNQAKTHNFYSNGTVAFANSISVSGNGNISGSNIFGSQATMLTSLNVGNSGATSSQVFITGDKTINSSFRIVGSPFTAIMDNVNPTSGYSPFFFNTYENSNTFIPPSRYFRARGTEASPTAVTASDVVQLSSYAVYADSGNTYKDVFNTSVVVTSNDGVGNVAADYVIQGFNANSKLSITTNTIANNISINSNNFMKLSFYTAAALTAITGQLGWIAAVSDSAGGSHPNGMIAFWDTTNTRWSYIHDNSAV